MTNSGALLGMAVAAARRLVVVATLLFALAVPVSAALAADKAQLIATEKTGRIRMCHARPETLAATADWLAEQRAIWEGRADRLEAYVMKLMEQGDDG